MYLIKVVEFCNITYFNGHSIENVQTYKFLGVLFSDSGTFSRAKLDLYKRGLKAIFKLKSILETYPQT